MESLQRLRQYLWLFLLWFVVVGIGVIGSFWEYCQEKNLPVTVAPAAETLLTPEITLPALDSVATPPAYTAQSVWLYDRNSGSVLYEDNAHTATSVASLAKLMTALVSYEEFSLDDSVPIGTSAAALGNRAKFFSSDVFSVYDLLHAMLIFSANDAAEALSRAYPGDMDAFVQAMNARAASLGLTNTQFSNPSGLDHSNQYSTAADIGRIANTVLEIPLLSQIVSQPVQQIREQRTGRIDTVYTTNALLYRHPRYRGMKTGTTEMAGESLVVRIVPPEDDILLLGAPPLRKESRHPTTYSS
ncbi:serine hydrolase [Candidatus Woesebacteria bacterium]|nr:serine hydrolase [Candidatus Woesebacteria bacterium]